MIRPGKCYDKRLRPHTWKCPMSSYLCNSDDSPSATAWDPHTTHTRSAHRDSRSTTHIHDPHTKCSFPGLFERRQAPSHAPAHAHTPHDQSPHAPHLVLYPRNEGVIAGAELHYEAGVGLNEVPFPWPVVRHVCVCMCL
jgi:hypothetical protein